MIFIGKNCKIKNNLKIILGKTTFVGDYVQINALSKEGVKIGNNVSFLSGTIIECTGVIRDIGEGLIIGNDIGIDQNCFIQVRGKVIIGSNVIFGPNVAIFSRNYDFLKQICQFQYKKKLEKEQLLMRLIMVSSMK